MFWCYTRAVVVSSIGKMAIFEAPQFPDPSQMRRAGKPTVTSKPGGVGTMARLADQEARHKSVLRPTGGASYDPKTREMRRLAVVVEQLAKEQVRGFPNHHIPPP